VATSVVAIVADINPQPHGLSATAARFEHQHWRIIGVQLGSGHDMAFDRRDQRSNSGRGPADPVGQRGDSQVDAVAGIGR